MITFNLNNCLGTFILFIYLFFDPSYDIGICTVAVDNCYLYGDGHLALFVVQQPNRFIRIRLCIARSLCMCMCMIQRVCTTIKCNKYHITGTE
jgi:hypothetical protein